MPRTTYSTTLAVAYDDALEALAADPTRILQEATDRAAYSTGEVVRPLTCEIAGFQLARDVAIEVDALVPAELLRATIPLRWRAAEGAGWFPTVTGTLDISMTHGDPSRTTLTLHAEHRPPFGAAGTLIDRTLARHVATTALEGFLRELAGRLVVLVDTLELSSDLREVPTLSDPTDVRAEAQFSPDGPVRTVLHSDPVHDVHLVGFEPWQSTPLAAADATVTVAILAGHGQLVHAGTTLELTAGEVEVVPGGVDALLVAGGQRMIVLESRVAAPVPSRPPPAPVTVTA